MKKRSLGMYLLLLVVLSPIKHMYSCGWDPSWDLEFYSFFEPELMSEENLMPFHYTFQLLYDYEWQKEAARREENIADWSQYLNGRFEEADIEAVIYAGAAGSINPFSKALTEGAFPGIKRYLELARACEPYNVSGKWNTPKPRLSGPNDRLVSDLREFYAESGDEWLQLRAAFQLVRLLHYDGYYDQAMAAYNELILPLKRVNSPIQGWALSQYAGAMRGTGEQRVRSAYLFTRVFAEVPSHRVAAWLSFRITNEADWQELLSMAENESEKAAIYAIRAIDPTGVALGDMRKIFEIDPQNEFLDLLLIREINKLEEELLEGVYTLNSGFIQNDNEVMTEGRLQALELQEFVREVISGNGGTDLAVWKLADAYLFHLSGQSARSWTELERMNSTEGKSVRGRVLQYSIELSQLQRLTPMLEQKLWQEYQEISVSLPSEVANELQMYRDGHFARVYDKQGELEKALLARGNTYLVREQLDVSIVSAMLEFYEKKTASPYEKWLQDKLKNEYSKLALLEMKGTALFRANKLDQAIEVFKAVKLQDPARSGRDWTIGPDPFAHNIRDIINCEPECLENKYTKLTLAETMRKLERKIKEEPENAGNYHHLLGNAWFNLSYYGAAWNGLDYYRSYQWRSSPEDPTNYMNLERAKGYYRQSIRTAQNDELAALSTLMLAKCEVVEREDIGEVPYEIFGYDQLLGKYRHTDVFQKALDECRYFYVYSRR